MTSLLLLIVASTWFVCVEGYKWDWKCDPVNPQEGLDLVKVAGRWFAIEVIQQNNSELLKPCIVVDMIWRDNSSMIYRIHFGLDRPSNLLHFWYRTFDDRVRLISPSQWFRGGDPEVVVDFAPDGSSMTTTQCTGTGLRSFVLVRNTTIDLRPLHARLLRKNIPGLWEARPQPMTNCSSIEEAKKWIEICSTIAGGSTMCNDAAFFSVAPSLHCLLAAILLSCLV